MKNKVILFDIDYTLFDVGKYRTVVFARLQELLAGTSDVPRIANKTYEEIREHGWFEAKAFTQQLLTHIQTTVDPKVLEDVWKEKKLLEDCLYPESKDVLQKLSDDGYTLGIFSSGVTQFQASKIATFRHFFEDEHIHIHEIKDNELPDIVKKYEGRQIILIDDFIPVIEKAKVADPTMIAIWIKRGKLAERVGPSENNPPNYIVENLRELLPIVEKA